MFENAETFCLDRVGHYKAVRRKLVDLIGAEAVAEMDNSEVATWFKDNGYATYICYTGEYDDSDDILVAKIEDVKALVSKTDAFWVHR